MAGINRITGTPWHIEKYARKEGDPRRHKSKCAYYVKEHTFCSKKHMKCFGSAHCASYYEKIENNSFYETRETKYVIQPFQGIRKINLNYIESKNIINQVDMDKVARVVQYYNNYKKMDCYIEVTSAGNKYKLMSGFNQFYAARLLKLKEIEAVFVAQVSQKTPVIQQKKKKIKFRKGSIVKHKRYGKGKVYKIEGNKIHVLFNEIDLKTFRLDDCCEKGYLELIE